MNFHKKEKITIYLFFALLFIATVMFFMTIHPVTIISGDDWGNLSLNREAYPQWGAANPIKVTPELSFPWIGMISTYLIMPFGFGFLEAISHTTAIFISFLVSLFLLQLFLLMRDKLKVGLYNSLLMVSVYYLCIFGALRTSSDNQSLYLLWEVNITCFYHYITPALINSSLVLYFMRNEGSLSYDDLKKRGSIYVGWLILASYICIFSSLFANVFFAVYCGVSILTSFIKNSYSLIKTLKEKPFHTFILLLWLVSVVYEINGGRAQSIGSSDLDVNGAVNFFISLIEKSQPLFIVFILTFLLLGAFFFYKEKERKENNDFKYAFLVCTVSCAITFVALILICARAGGYYTSRPVVMWGVFMYIIISALISMGYLITNYKIINYVMPIIIISLINKTISQDTSLKESNNLDLKYNIALAISQNIIDQVVYADKNNIRKINLIVPKGDNNDNWPFPIYEGPSINRVLKIYGIIRNDIDITVIPDESLNHKLGIPFS
ncbi:hypothetical protein HGO23_19030 [Xenorhabdus budapestensis]|uniref:Inner membrane protein n=1 Tax=Xenorhabdus budapestensis TaxID=290110 RepID=A0ABX7VJ92_XENBU|nr:hypothetical protein [Xenorhabdus budapestensis]QTL39807.1 hypothetical protein HGO23_19030 [Xenorhabdus budapestensis]